jgi:antitoxin (DNA-binding transcriptional repressor) of toxin-antitoxin stability system
VATTWTGSCHCEGADDFNLNVGVNERGSTCIRLLPLRQRRPRRAATYESLGNRELPVEGRHIASSVPEDCQPRPPVMDQIERISSCISWFESCPLTSTGGGYLPPWLFPA